MEASPKEPPTEAMESLSVSNSDNAESSGTSNPYPTDQLSLEQRFCIVRSVGEECIRQDELLNMLAKKPEPVCYDGFESSGRMRIARGIMKAIQVKKLTSAGCRVKIWIADWFAMLNNKLGGDLKKTEADICQMGMDQCKVNELAREYSDDIVMTLKGRTSLSQLVTPYVTWPKARAREFVEK